ncbi:ABC transporter ATP-binding protein [Mitsuokella sp. AF21-1AC]|nr:ABC transporter ATP-binding protein [Mitsuokella sp. AF21-1AC]
MSWKSGNIAIFNRKKRFDCGVFALKTSPDSIRYYFQQEKRPLAIVTASGLLYNVGMIASPWFDGQLAQGLYDIFGGHSTASDMYRLCALYLLVILVVQGARYFKRLYVRKFANNVSLAMRDRLYRRLVQMPSGKLAHEDTGSLMTKVIADIDTCVEGMRKATTEVFDTGVVMVAYLIMLLYYDWRLTLCVLVFPPIAYVIASFLRRRVARAAALSKEKSGLLSGVTLDRTRNALTYRLYGEETNADRRCEEALQQYEQAMIRANLYENALQPLYRIIALTGTVLIIWQGGRNVLGQGFTAWDIAAFSTYLACFLKLAVKASHGAKLFNAVQKAQVSWRRIRGFFGGEGQELPAPRPMARPAVLRVRDLSFTYPGEKSPVFSHLSFTARPGEIIGITGPVASGKTTLGRLFLADVPHGGHICFGAEEIGPGHRPPLGIVGYMGHVPELFAGTLAENVRFGSTRDISEVLADVCLMKDLLDFPEGLETRIGPGGLRLSGGQQARLVLARTLFTNAPLLVLDDPFASVDYAVEAAILESLRRHHAHAVILLISHRLAVFPKLDQVICLTGTGEAIVSTHAALYRENDTYRRLYDLQHRGGPDGVKGHEPPAAGQLPSPPAEAPGTRSTPAEPAGRTAKNISEAEKGCGRHA